MRLGDSEDVNQKLRMEIRDRLRPPKVPTDAAGRSLDIKCPKCPDYLLKINDLEKTIKGLERGLKEAHRVPPDWKQHQKELIEDNEAKEEKAQELYKYAKKVNDKYKL